MNKDAKILIVGAGIAGLYLAASLKKKGFDPIVIEKSEEWYPGYSIGIWYNGYKMIEGLGGAKEFLEHGEEIKNYYVCNGAEKIDINLNLHEIFPNFNPAHTNISRKNLHEILLNHCKGIEIKRGISIEELEKKNDKYIAKLTNGEIIVSDLLVGADGINSQIRSLIFPEEKAIEYSNWRGWYFWIKGEVNLPNGAFEIAQKDRFFIGFPHRKDGWCGFAAIPCEHEVPDEIDERRKFLSEQFKDNKIISNLLLKVEDFTEVRHSDLAHIKLENAWYKDSIVLIGDSAHAFEPVAGLGASMAMEDAYVLADELEKNSVEQALKNYYERRKKRVGNAQKITREIWWMTEATNSAFVNLREILLKKFIKRIQKHFINNFEQFFKELP